jgi:hypothetical protein
MLGGTIDATIQSTQKAVFYKLKLRINLWLVAVTMKRVIRLGLGARRACVGIDRGPGAPTSPSSESDRQTSDRIAELSEFERPHD